MRSEQSEKYLRRPVTQVRRRDRALDDAGWMDRLLAMGAMGHLAVCWEGQPYLHTNLYWYDGARLYWHTAAVGKLRAILDTGAAPACLTVAEQGRLLPASTPFDFSTEYASVILYGTVRVVAGLEEKRYALEGLMGRYAPHLTPGVDYTPMPDGDVDQTSVYCLEIDRRAGKHNIKPDEYPAYAYPAGSFIEAERAAGRYTTRPKELA
jgi:nitroimidazol reductase NimA-like FMN-containing flavoprotein (pyridoxamine 5'-phosphate oxidase superfamily)